MEGELLALLVIHLLLTGLPGVAAALLVASRGERREPVLLGVALVGSGAAAMLAFWGYYGSHELGETASFFVAFGSLLLSGWLLRTGGIDRALLRRLAVPLALWALGSAFLVYLGFLHGGTREPLSLASIRFSGQLPSDNQIPRFFSEWFFSHGHQSPPPEFPGEWLASDRPPLQVGYALLERPFGWDSSGLHYQVMGVVLQQLWIVGLWALLVAGRAGRLTRGLAMLTVLVSDLAIVNGFFVWPKLLPAAMLLAAAALVLTPLWPDVRRSSWGAALLAALLGLAMMGHGGSVFGVIPLAAIALARGGLPSWRWLGVLIAVGILFVGPWSAYQRWGDPPGDRLAKWMLGGVSEVDGRSSLQAITDSYREIGLGGTLHYKAENFVSIVGGGPMIEDLEHSFEELKAGRLGGAAAFIRAILFYYLLPSLGLMLVGLGAIAASWRRRARDPAEWSLALWCLAAFMVGAVVWALLMFGRNGAGAVIHQGSLVIPIFGFCAAAVGVRAVYPRFGTWLMGVNAALMLALHAPMLTPMPGVAYSAWAGLLAAGALVGFCLVALRAGEIRARVAEPVPVSGGQGAPGSALARRTSRLDSRA
ncbi:MAG TPA: hypothetical protein VF731_14365 [Solirubrobacterales bacterium]